MRRAVMNEFVDVAHSSELPPGTMKAVLVDGRKIVVCHTEAGWFAADNSCPHRGGPLAQGDLIGSAIVCPWHVWTFDLASGRNDINPEITLCTHEVREVNGAILIRLAEVIEEPDVR